MRLTGYGVRLWLAAVVLLAGLDAAARPQKEHPIPKELLERVAEWADAFWARMPSYAAEETLVQTLHARGKAGARRTIVSDYFYVRMEESRGEFRDVLSVDGKVLLSAEKRAAKRARLAEARSTAEFAAHMDSPDKHRLSPEYFEGLARLSSRFATRNHGMMRYFFGADTSDPPSRYVLIAYRQVAGEGLMVIEDKYVLPSGQAWVDPDDGHVARIEEEVRVKDTAYSLAVEFAKPEEIGAWAPSNITVRVFEKGRLALENSYSYSNFRRLGLGPSTAASPLQKN
jgi:hypothetical protein